MKGNVNVVDTAVGVYCRPPDQEEEVDEAYRQQIGRASCRERV